MGLPYIPLTPEGTDLTGKTIIVTGGNAGLGYESARQFLILKASRVILAVRTRSKGQEAVSALRADPAVKEANPEATIEVFELDLDDYQSAIKFAEQVKHEVKELDILLNNGGTVFSKFQTSKSGHERVMQVNAYSSLLLSLELLPLLRSTAQVRGAPTRLTFVGSSGQVMHNLKKSPVRPEETILGHFDDPNNFPGMTRYCDSKLTVNAYVRKLAQLIPASEVIINNLCPGVVKTGFDKTLPIYIRGVMYVYRQLTARDVDEGARTYIYAAVLAGPESHGKFIFNNEIHVGTPWIDEPVGKEFTDKLWAELVADLSKVDPSLSSFV